MQDGAVFPADLAVLVRFFRDVEPGLRRQLGPECQLEGGGFPSLEARQNKVKIPRLGRSAPAFSKDAIFR